jgi:hypothetical protein
MRYHKIIMTIVLVVLVVGCTSRRERLCREGDENACFAAAGDRFFYSKDLDELGPLVEACKAGKKSACAEGQSAGGDDFLEKYQRHLDKLEIARQVEAEQRALEAEVAAQRKAADGIKRREEEVKRKADEEVKATRAAARRECTSSENPEPCLKHMADALARDDLHAVAFFSSQACAKGADNGCKVMQVTEQRFSNQEANQRAIMESFERDQSARREMDFRREQEIRRREDDTFQRRQEADHQMIQNITRTNSRPTSSKPLPPMVIPNPPNPPKKRTTTCKQAPFALTPTVECVEE